MPLQIHKHLLPTSSQIKKAIRVQGDLFKTITTSAETYYLTWLRKIVPWPGIVQQSKEKKDQIASKILYVLARIIFLIVVTVNHWDCNSFSK